MSVNTEVPSRKLRSVIADAGAFLKHADLQNFSERVFTLSDVVGEIRDSATRSRLSVLPYKLEFREPSIESIKYVTEFSKKTGDYRSLSPVDIRVIALTYQLEKEFCNADHIRQEPAKKVDANADSPSQNKPLIGFYSERKQHAEDNTACDSENGTDSNDETSNGDQSGNTDENMSRIGGLETTVTQNCQTNNDVTQPNIEMKAECKESSQNEEMTETDDIDNKDNDLEDDDEDDDDDGEGWICPQNIKKVKDEMGIIGDMHLSETDIENACFTTDFAIQNVLIQMGLHVISINGMLIQQARSYILKCYGCYKETTVMDRQFCPNCGNKTLMKVAVTASAEGTIQYHYPRKRPFNIRGTKYSLPTPKGGRSDEGPLLVEDQRIPRNRMPRKKDHPDALDPDFIARSSPFASKDVTSKAFNHGYHVRQRDWRNPNEGKKKSGRKHK